PVGAENQGALEIGERSEWLTGDEQPPTFVLVLGRKLSLRLLRALARLASEEGKGAREQKQHKEGAEEPVATAGALSSLFSPARGGEGLFGVGDRPAVASTPQAVFQQRVASPEHPLSAVTLLPLSRGGPECVPHANVLRVLALPLGEARPGG